jgi:hypothetical protein
MRRLPALVRLANAAAPLRQQPALHAENRDAVINFIAVELVYVQKLSKIVHFPGPPSVRNNHRGCNNYALRQKSGFLITHRRTLIAPPLNAP